MAAAGESSSRRGMAWMAAAESIVIIRAWSRVVSLNSCRVRALPDSARILRISAKLRSSRPPSAPDTYSSIRIAATRRPPVCSSERSSAARSSMKRRCSGDTPGCLRGGPERAPWPARSCTRGEPYTPMKVRSSAESRSSCQMFRLVSIRFENISCAIRKGLEGETD
ncbi:hypothetical protein D9M68_565210 [compost metagenome]